VGVRDAFAAMGELVRGIGPVWGAAIVRRALLTLGLIVLLVFVDSSVLMHGTPRASLPFMSWTQLALLTVLWVFLWADAMRLNDPAFRVTPKVFGKGLWIGAYVVLLLFVASIPIIVLYAFGQVAVAGICQYVVFSVVVTRLWFAFFLIAKNERPVRSSWRLTAGITFLPTLVLIVAAALPGIVVDRIFFMLPHDLSARIVFVLMQSTDIVVSLVTSTWLYSLTARWLPVAECLHPELDAMPDRA
jgi:hypothetical protein